LGYYNNIKPLLPIFSQAGVYLLAAARQKNRQEKFNLPI
jgi:hypothetical protein